MANLDMRCQILCHLQLPAPYCLLEFFSAIQYIGILWNEIQTSEIFYSLFNLQSSKHHVNFKNKALLALSYILDIAILGSLPNPYEEVS